MIQPAVAYYYSEAYQAFKASQAKALPKPLVPLSPPPLGQDPSKPSNEPISQKNPPSAWTKEKYSFSFETDLKGLYTMYLIAKPQGLTITITSMTRDYIVGKAQ